MERGKVKTLCRLTLSLKIKMKVRKVRFNLRKATALYLITFLVHFLPSSRTIYNKSGVEISSSKGQTYCNVIVGTLNSTVFYVVIVVCF